MATVAGVRSQMTVAQASADIFEMLRLSPGVGRLWTSDDETRGNTDIAVLGYRFWRQQLGGDPVRVLGKDVTIGKRTYTDRRGALRSERSPRGRGPHERAGLDPDGRAANVGATEYVRHRRSNAAQA